MKMKREVLLKLFTGLFKSNDAIIVAGSSFCKELSTFVNIPNFMFVEDEDGVAAAMALGVALGTPKRVFFLCEDYYALKCLDTLSNLAVSRCSNLFVIVFATKVYPDLEFCPTIYGSLSSLKGMLFNMGFKAYGYTGHFTNVQQSKTTMKNILKNLKGPAVGIIELSPRAKPVSANFNHTKMVDAFKDLVVSDIGTSLFNPPTELSEASWQNS